jgi:DNA polymerase-1
VNEEKIEGKRWHFIQTLAGDQTDGYAGCPGLGIKRAVALFEEKGYRWKTVVDAFAEKDLSEEVAIENARLAKILTANDYDFINKQPILWTPTSNYRLDD